MKFSQFGGGTIPAGNATQYLDGAGASIAAVSNIFTSLGLSISISDPLVWTERGFIESASQRVSSYQHGIAAMGGYDTADITLVGNQSYLEDWICYGLGRHIEVYNPALETIWAGFVNEVSIQLGPMAQTRGPLTNLRNYVKIKYQDFSTGAQAVEDWIGDTTSESLFGVWAKVLSGGRMSDVTAAAAQETDLLENKWPETTTTISTSGDLSVRLGCRGYYHMLNYPYDQKGTTWTLREKLIDVLVQSPNIIFNPDPSAIATNTLDVFKVEDKDRLGWEIIKELVAMGGDSDNLRRTFGIYAGRRAHYQPVPDAVEYTMRLSEGNRVRTALGGEVKPWDVKPGRWMTVTDYLVGKPVEIELRRDPRSVFIESVSFSAPNDLTINGGKVATLAQQLSKLGLGGMG